MSVSPACALRSFLVSLSSVLIGLGCSKKVEPTAAPTAAPAALTAAPAAAPAAAAALKIAFAYVGPVGDAGWTFAHDLGRKAVAEKFGSKAANLGHVPDTRDDPDTLSIVKHGLHNHVLRQMVHA